MIINNVIALAKTAKVSNVPTILSTVLEERGGYLIMGLQDVKNRSTAPSSTPGKTLTLPTP